MKNIIALLVGILFGSGLVISGMTDTHKVIGFLDLMNWDYDLMFVMVGAISIALIAFTWSKTRSSTFLGEAFQWPTKTVIDRKLLGGAALFGMGWGLFGLCPAPAIVGLLYGYWPVYLFVLSMLIGFKLIKM